MRTARLGYVLAAFAAGCSRAPAGPGGVEDAASPPAAVPSSVAAPAPAPVEAGTRGPTARLRLNPTCRAMAVAGTPSISLSLDAGPRPLAMDDLAGGWVTLPTAADTLTVTLPRTGRELAFVGPGRVEPCVGTDEAWLLRGRFEGSRGAGEAPGAEQWVVTPFGVVRYGGAILEVEVEETLVRASLKGGTATLLPDGTSAWELLDATAPRVVKGAPVGPGSGALAASAARCAKESAAAKALEDALIAPDAAASPAFGALAMRANDAHVLARAACAVAKLRADPNSLTRWSPSR